MSEEVDAKVVDLAIFATPSTTPSGVKIVATFTLLARPMRINDCKLAIATSGKFMAWTPDRSIRIASWARDEIAETARQAYVDAQKRMAV